MDYFKNAPIQNDELNCANRMVLLTIEIPSLRQREKDLFDSPSYRPSPEAVVGLMQAAKAVDADLVRWSETVPKAWHYVSITTENEVRTDVYPRSIDIYFDDLVASTWNTWRAYRLYILTIVSRCASILSNLRDNLDAERENCEVMDTIQELVDGICSSVPFHLGYAMDGNARGSLLYPHAPGSALKPSLTGALGVFMVKWPLGVASTMSCIPEGQRRWIRDYQVL